MRNTALLSMAAAGAMVLPLAAQAADMPVRRAAPVVETFSWTGVYIGASGGQLRGGSDDWVSATPLSCNNPPLSFSGPSGPANNVSAIVASNAASFFGNEIASSTGTGVGGCYPTPA